MLKFQAITKEELRLAAVIQHKRQTEAERKQRIFNPRFRKIGVSGGKVFPRCPIERTYSLICSDRSVAKLEQLIEWLGGNDSLRR